MIFISGKAFAIVSPNFNDTARLTFASEEKLPLAPGSRPPCPGSLTIVCSGFLLLICAMTEVKRKEVKSIIVAVIIFFNMLMGCKFEWTRIAKISAGKQINLKTFFLLFFHRFQECFYFVGI
jgi:hypothetical protein